VRIRSRKPCVLARRRLFGWKVRLLTMCLFRAVAGRIGPVVWGRPGRLQSETHGSCAAARVMGMRKQPGTGCSTVPERPLADQTRGRVPNTTVNPLPSHGASGGQRNDTLLTSHDDVLTACGQPCGRPRPGARAEARARTTTRAAEGRGTTCRTRR
jgi:hypothetical protein